MSGAPVDVFQRIAIGGEPLAELAVPMRVVACMRIGPPQGSLADSAPRSSTCASRYGLSQRGGWSEQSYGRPPTSARHRLLARVGALDSSVPVTPIVHRLTEPEKKVQANIRCTCRRSSIGWMLPARVARE